ncbi:unnamed protein product [Meganyctiphanes norvegica]|uniref:Fe2OG dioxygenase domain-containing protein n=1 Tax=Meganyctiphanes norvegica TaxID=48144 RepID=A0AAV2SSC7_MEGNR
MMENKKMNLEDFKIKEAPGTLYYIPDFISPEEESQFMTNIYNAPKPKWTQLSHRRLQNWGGLPHPKGMVAEIIPQWLQTSMNSISSLGVFGEKKPNHALVNEYESGQGIMPHEDGPLFYPTITTINLGSHTVLDYYSPISQDESYSENQVLDFSSRLIGSLLLEPRSLLIVQDEMYTSFLHGIREVSSDIVNMKMFNLQYCSAKLGQTLNREKRISLTIRHVPKVLKANLIFGNKKR